MEKLRSIQVLRGIAACAVVVLHAIPDVEVRGGVAIREIGRAGYGAFGVDLFFVISGFIMANVAEGRTAGAFLSDRLWRIYPLWWIAVLPWLFLLSGGLSFVASSLTLWPIYGHGYQIPALKVGWTLSFELLFYAGMTLAIASRPAIPLALYGLFLVGGLATQSPLLQFIGNPMALEFLMGVLVARLPRSPRLGLLIPVGLAAVAMTSSATGDAEATLAAQFALWRALEWGVPAALIVLGALSLEPLMKHRLFDGPVAIGDASYSIYLFHPIVVYGFGLPGAGRLLLAIAVGWAVHLVIERRVLTLRKRAFTFGGTGLVKAA